MSWIAIVIVAACSAHAQNEKVRAPGAAEMFADALRADASRAAGKPLAKTELSEGGGKWSANKEIVFGENGVTTSAPSSASIGFPATAGKLHLEADVTPKGSAFVGLVLGRGDLTGLFWQNLSVMLIVWGDGRYNLFAAGKNQIETPEKWLVDPEGVNHVELLLDTVARTVTAQINGKIVLKDAPLPKDVALDKVSAAGFHFQEPVTAGQPVVSNFRLNRTSLTAAGLAPEDYSSTFVAPDRETTLRWRASDPGPKGEIPYAISDYWGQRLGEGVAKGEDGIFSLKHSFPRGYAEIAFPESGQTFGVTSLEPHTGPADPFFCMDAAITWLELDPTRREGLVKIMSRSGIAMARERFDAPFGPTPGSYNWEAGTRKVDSMRKTYAANQVPILEILGSAKAKFGMVAGQTFPQNLPVVASEWVAVAQHFDHVWAGAEIYNESDLRPAPADQYAPMVKAFSYSLAQAKSRAPLVAGTFATAPPGPYFETCTANGLFADADAVSFHSYDKAPDMGSLIGRYREWLKKSNVEAMPLWLTECGKPWKLGPGRPPQAEDALSACEITAMGVEAMVGGVARYYPFVFVYYEEGLKNFGMMGREATPLRSMAAYAQCICALSGKEYLGDLQGLDASIKLARTFGTSASHERVVVLYTGVVDPKAALSFPSPIDRLEGADGRTLSLADGKVPIPDGLTYVWTKASGISLATEAARARLYQLGRNPPKPKRLASPVILQLLPQELPARTSARRYLVSHETARALPIHVRLHNLSPAPLEITPELTLPGGAPDKKETVTVPALSYVDVAWKPDAVKALDFAATRFVVVTAKSSADVQPSPLAIPLTMEGTLEQHLATHQKQTPMPITELTRWQGNAAPGKSRFSVIEGNTWRHDVSFSSHQGNWTYPRFTLPESPNPATDYGFLLRARVVGKGRPAIIAKPAVGSGVSFWVPEIFPGDGEWHVAYIPFAEFKPGPGGVGNQNTRLDPASWKTVEIGMGSNDRENALEISHFLIVGGAGGE